MSPTPTTESKNRLAQRLGFVVAMVLATVTFVEATEQTRALSQFAVMLKYSGFGLCVAWPLLQGQDGKQQFGIRVAVGLGMMLLGVAIHGCVRLGYL
jgi:hypothetical protein